MSQTRVMTTPGTRCKVLHNWRSGRISGEPSQFTDARSGRCRAGMVFAPWWGEPQNLLIATLAGWDFQTFFALYGTDYHADL